MVTCLITVGYKFGRPHGVGFVYDDLGILRGTYIINEGVALDRQYRDYEESEL